MLMRDIEEDTNKLKDISCSQIIKINLLKHSYYGNPSTNVVQSISKFQCTFHRSRTNNSKICVELQKTQIAKGLLRKNKAGGITFSNFKLYL